MEKKNILLAQQMLDEGIIHKSFYLKQAPELVISSDIDMALHYLNEGERQGLAPSGFFDPVFYRRMNPDLEDVDELLRHYLTFGREEERWASLAAQLIAAGLDTSAVQEGLVPAPDLPTTDPHYVHAFATSLTVIDNDPRYFSSEFYLARHPDIEGTEPIVHYLNYGRHEGRITNISLMKGIFIDEQKIDPSLPFVLIGVHEASKTGAPIVGMDLARQMASTHNIIFVSLRDGPLLETAKALFPVVVVASQIYEENQFYVDIILSSYPVDDAIFSSTCCLTFIMALSLRECRTTCLVHEFLEYMIPFRDIIYHTDLLVFSSRELLKSWQYMLDNYNRDPASVMVLPQPASGASSRRMTKAEARAKISAATGLDLDGATIVLAAGQIQIRKGTDIFLQIGSQLKRTPGKFVSIWIGEQVSEFEMSFGIWLHAQMERSRDAQGRLPVHFEPAGPLYTVLMDAADVFLVTSRLDPLPNVALDAAARDIPVIAFAGATGLADLADQGKMNLVEVEIGAIDQVIAAIKSHAMGRSASAPRTQSQAANAELRAV
ncbi:glycosyltransferase [Novosphingobium pentaromativorans]|uniref:Glycosyl transferase family 1 domain-containing protein n=1 Tax=Novosphingobium pentaromativorans US6-1 TaxID=1088721 RepID=G6EKF4_9SPHN|nr:glycosyltransferase [Novosphingobium pentaromativorans]AIT82872.1 hypothetical protein JI59_25900 [Novosphingobium pentaromativorans US6-1]EHJ58188.1 hypothetical protein NSU_4825 [Novosphingobium pentaromativorans US6-1]